MRWLPAVAVLSLAAWWGFRVAGADRQAGAHLPVLKGFSHRVGARLAARSGVELALSACGLEGQEPSQEFEIGGGTSEVRWRRIVPGAPCPFPGEDLGDFVKRGPRQEAPAPPLEEGGFWQWLGFSSEPLPMVLAPPLERVWWISSRGVYGDHRESLRGRVTVRD